MHPDLISARQAAVWRLLWLATAVAVIVGAPRVVYGQETDLTASESVFSLSPLLVSLIVGTILPFVVGLATKYGASGKVKALVNIVVSAVAALITSATVDGGGAVLSQETVVLFLLTLFASIASYLGVWGQVDINAKLAPHTGVGHDGPVPPAG